MKQKKLTPAIAFCLVCIIGMTSVAGCFCLLGTDHWSGFFWFNLGEAIPYRYADTGMDFYHSIEYLKGNNPYEQWHVIYPPLANLMFKVLFHMVPDEQKNAWTDEFMASVAMRKSENDLRVWMPTAMLFIVFFLLMSLLTYSIIVNYDGRRFRGVMAFSAMFSYGYLYALERGNIVILAMTTALLFVLYHDSDVPWVREAALLSLAVSANLKLYPAVFGIILLYEKRWKDAIRTVIYGVLLFVLPCLVFKNGLNNIPMFLNNVKGFADGVGTSNLGTSLDRLLYSILELSGRVFNFPMPYEFYTRVAVHVDRICLVVCLFCGLVLPKKWQKCLCCTLGIILLSNQGIYGTVFITLPAVMYLHEEETFSRRNIVPFVGILLTLAILPVFNKWESAFSRTSLRLQVGLGILLLYVIVATVCTLKARHWKLFAPSQAER